MELSIYTWNGIAINDGSTFRASIPPGGMANFRTNPISVPRANDFPQLSRTMLPAHTFTVLVDVLPGNTIGTKREILKGYFNPRDQTRHNLIAKDTNDSDRQWYLTGYPISFAPANNSKITWVITLAVETPEWRLVTSGTNTWNITATGQTNAVTNIGNVNVAPSFTITPTTVKAGGLKYRRWIPIYNNLDVSFNQPFDITSGGLDTEALIADTTISNQINEGSGITNSATSWAIDTSVGGGLPTTGGMFYVGTEQCTYTGIATGTISGVVRGVNGTTAATHADNAVMTLSHMQADGGDIRIWEDGGFADYWLNGINTATTQIWKNLQLSPRHEGTTSVTISNSGGVATLSFSETRTNKSFLEAMAKAVNKIVLIDSEAFVFTAADTVAYTLTGCTRAQKGTSAATHTAPKTVRHIEKDTWLLYGDSTLSAYVTDDDFKPIFDLTSTNETWDYSNFFETSTPRPGAFSGGVSASKTELSYAFTGNENTFADPSEELGLALVGSQSAYNMTSETGTIAWALSHPAGITSVDYSGSKYAVNSFPEVCGIQYLQPNTAWITADNQAAPASVLSWEDFGPSTVSLSPPYPTSIRFALDGSLSPATGEIALAQFDTVSVTFDSSTLPTASIGAEAAVYWFDFTMTNNASGEYIKVKTPCLLNTALVVDCENKLAYLADGARASVTRSTNRDAWLDLRSGSNTLQFDDVGTAAVTVVTTHRDRTI